MIQFGRLSGLVVLATLAGATLSLAGCGSGSGSDRVRFADEGERCADNKTLYIDESGDELRCEGGEYKGPLTRDERRETLRLTSRLASDGSLSGEDKDRVREFADDPPAVARTHLVPKTILPASGNVWVLGQAEDASFHLAKVDAATSDVATLALASKSIDGFAVVGGTAWFFSTGAWTYGADERSSGVPVQEVDLAAPGRVEELIVSDDRSAAIAAMAVDGDSLWLGMRVYAEEGVSTARLVRFDLRSRRVTSAVELPGETAVRSIVVTRSAVWIEGEYRLWKLVPGARRARPIDLPIGVIRAGAGALWALGGRTSPQLFRIDLAKGGVVARTAAPDDILEIEAGRSGVWVLREGGALQRVDLRSNRLETVASLDVGLIPLLYTLDGAVGKSLAVTEEAAWVTLDSGGRLARVDAATGQVSLLELGVDYDLGE